MSSLQALLDAQERRQGPPARSSGGARSGWGHGDDRPRRHREDDRSRGGGGWNNSSGRGRHPSGGGNGRWDDLAASSPRHDSSRDNPRRGKAKGPAAEPTYEERRAGIERRAVEESLRAARAKNSRLGQRDDGGATGCEEDISSLQSWVGPLRGNKCTYYQDREKRFPFYTDGRGHGLLMELMDTNRALLRLNHAMLEERASAAGGGIGGATDGEEGATNTNINATSPDCDAKDVLIRIGQGLYAHKPTLRTKGVTWSTEEYSHPGLQRMYLRMKSIQRFTEVWCLLERCDALGAFDDAIDEAARESRPLRIAAVGGGPGYELLATKLFFAERAPGVDVELSSMDLCPAWRPYVEELGFRFMEYDINNAEGTDPLQAAGMAPGDLDFVLVSCLMIYCTTDAVLTMFRRLVHEGGVKAILVSERGERTKACTMMEERGGEVIRLIDPSGGMDERQALWCSREFSGERLRTHTPDFEGHQRSSVFPNVPYCEHKERRGGGRSYGYARHASRRS